MNATNTIQIQKTCRMSVELEAQARHILTTRWTVEGDMHDIATLVLVKSQERNGQHRTRRFQDSQSIEDKSQNLQNHGLERRNRNPFTAWSTSTIVHITGRRSSTNLESALEAVA